MVKHHEHKVPTVNTILSQMNPIHII